MEGSSAHRLVQRTTEAVGSAWHVPRQRRLTLSLAVAVLSAIAFARIAEDYLTNDPLARWDVSFARWLAGERTTLGADFFRVFTDVGSPSVPLRSPWLSASRSTGAGSSLTLHCFPSCWAAPSC
jgi:hypothetical protein